MLLRHHRPLLGEAGGPLPVQAGHAQDVLEDARFLVERLFDEKRVVGDAERLIGAVDGRRRRSLREQRHRRQPQQQHCATGMHQHLGRGARANREIPLASAQPHAVGRRIALLDLDDLTRLELVLLDEVEKVAVLIGDALDGDRRVQLAGQQRLVVRQPDRSVRIRNRIAVRIDRRPAQHRVDAIDQPLGHRMLELLRFGMNVRPAHAHHLDQEQLDQAVPALHQRGQPFAGLGQPDTGIGLVVHETRFRQGLDHRRRGSRRHPERTRDPAHLDERVRCGVGALGLQDRLEVVLDCR